MSDHIIVEREPGLLTLRMNRLDKLNALTRAMYSRMAEELNAANDDRSVQAVLLAGSEECFTSGNDLLDFMNAPKEGLGGEVLQFMQALFEFKKPVVAAVAGPAVGIGTTLLLHCDFVYVSRDAMLKMPFVKLGLCPEYGSSLILPRLLGQARANDLLLLSESFTGEQAAAWGIANAALDGGAATFAKARETALQLLDLAPSAVQVSKRLMRAPGREELRQVIKEEGELFGARLKHPEAMEALAAFMQKRKPDFSKFL
ncbi:enoyl-CoA hydratase-related protein [Pseudomonas sp. N040]|uniref:enoyl-CoA hydratase-related protein n=1 Tax=Pseudomonas sp. N040 TaxID=2785325 RepID=UPI0018A2F528|nr:enoyl-CoA hydratase-related protein [Pseudomonas sp. N040]MBF7730526.1 enoyl-CoA hydratase/isomerase family protein [Pseudomonas sp. N040]MBW7014170.1 enoyl-CoA hydratase/isomerase family protein [Pseudomonas sp. N040]